MTDNRTYQLHLKGFVGGYDFDADYVDYILGKNKDNEVNVLIDSLGGQSSTALSIFSAFKRHGNVNVHFVGMNASAATIASLGAKHITIDSSAMYLVHKCSVGFFEWGQLNSDGLQALINNIEHQKADLDKLDANIAQMYATRCKKESADLLDLMKEGGWLTAKEALAWGFVDEITDYENESAPVLTDSMACAMSAAGIPIPAIPTIATQEQSAIARFFSALTQYISGKPTQIFHNKITLDEAQLDTLESAISADKQTIQSLQSQVNTLTSERDQLKTANSTLESEANTLRAEVDTLKKKPAAPSAQVVNDKGKESGEKSDAELYFESRASAAELFNSLP